MSLCLSSTALHLLSMLLGVRVPEGDGAAPSAAHGPHAMGVLLARAEGHQPPTLGTHLSLPGERGETVKPPCSAGHSPSTEVTLPQGTWKSRELLGIYSQSMSKADLGEGHRESKVTDIHRLEEPGKYQLGKSQTLLCLRFA